MTTVEADAREALLEGAAVELIPTLEGWRARIGMLEWSVEGLSAAECFLKLADILSAPIEEGRGQQ